MASHGCCGHIHTGAQRTHLFSHNSGGQRPEQHLELNEVKDGRSEPWGRRDTICSRPPVPGGRCVHGSWPCRSRWCLRSRVLLTSAGHALYLRSVRGTRVVSLGHLHSPGSCPTAGSLVQSPGQGPSHPVWTSFREPAFNSPHIPHPQLRPWPLYGTEDLHL